MVRHELLALKVGDVSPPPVALPTAVIDVICVRGPLASGPALAF
jgi:hypothetical protein